jgi:hypothetical protein
VQSQVETHRSVKVFWPFCPRNNLQYLQVTQNAVVALDLHIVLEKKLVVVGVAGITDGSFCLSSDQRSMQAPSLWLETDALLVQAALEG